MQKGPVSVQLEEPFPVITPPVRLLVHIALFHVLAWFLLLAGCMPKAVEAIAVYVQGPYAVRITAAGKGTDLAQLFCLDVNFDVVPSAPSVEQQ